LSKSGGWSAGGRNEQRVGPRIQVPGPADLIFRRGGVQPTLQAQAYAAEYVNRIVDYVPARIERAR
jgi:hypothetical protein